MANRLTRHFRFCQILILYQTIFRILSLMLFEACVRYFLKILRYIKFKNLDQITIKNNVYLYQHYQKTKTLCRHVSRFPRFTASD